MPKIKDKQLSIDTVMDDFRKVVEGMSEKRQQIFLQWIDKFTKYLDWELTFRPDWLIRYKRGDLVLAEFGFNVSAELGGKHWAIVVDKRNPKKADTVMVVPLSSLNENKTEEDLHNTDVYVGVIDEINEKKVYAVVNQMRAISKLRIYKPKKSKHKRIRLSTELLDRIDHKIREVYTKN